MAITAGAAVIGGGVAGLACACELADAGLDVRVFEAKNRLGGRAHSFRDRETGATIDNGQHVLLGCCDAARGFLDKIGSIERVAFHDQMTLTGAKGETLTIRPSVLPAPLHLLGSILRTRYFTCTEKLELGRAFARIARTPPEDGLNARDYLCKIKCPKRLADRLIDPILTSALNETASDASAQYARMVISRSLIENRRGCKLGVPDSPLLHLIEVPAVRYLSRRGCVVCMSTKIEKLDFSGDMVTSALLSDGKRIRPEYYVCAVPPWSLDEMGFATNAARRLRWRPMVCVHLFYDDPHLDFDRSCVVGEPFGWVFNKALDFGLNFGYIQAVASAAESLSGLANNEIIELAERAVAKAIPHPCKPALRRAVIYNANRATFSTGDTSDDLRPSTVTPVQNLFLAGDWTNTRWPATIEGAVRSGIEAAKAILRR